MKFKFGKQHLNYAIISFLTIIVTVMATSFILRITVAPPVSAAIEKNIAKSTAQEVIQVNILNACGVPGLASKGKEYLRNRGFDVVEIGNLEEISSKSMIIDRLGDIQSARQVAYALGITDSMIVSQIDSNLFLRSTIIIGNDYRDLKPFKDKLF